MKGYKAAQRAYDHACPPDDDDLVCPECGVVDEGDMSNLIQSQAAEIERLRVLVESAYKSGYVSAIYGSGLTATASWDRSLELEALNPKTDQ